MTKPMIDAILSLLLSFGVSTTTADHIRTLISPPEATTTQAVIVPVTITPIVENQPVYFGSTQPTPVYNPHPLTNPVIQSKPMEELTIEKVGYKDTDTKRHIRITARKPDGTIISDSSETFVLSIDGEKVVCGVYSDENGHITGYTYDYPFNDTEGRIMSYTLPKPDSVVIVTYKGTDYTVPN